MGLARIFGIGSDLQGDGRAGIVAARQLQHVVPPGVDVRELPYRGVSVAEAMDGVCCAIFIAVTRSRARPGTITRCDSCDECRRTSLRHAMAEFGLCDALLMARSIDLLPRITIVYGIEGAAFEEAEALSAEVQAAVDEVVKRVEGEVNEFYEEKQVLSRSGG